MKKTIAMLSGTRDEFVRYMQFIKAVPNLTNRNKFETEKESLVYVANGENIEFKLDDYRVIGSFNDRSDKDDILDYVKIRVLNKERF